MKGGASEKFPLTLADVTQSKLGRVEYPFLLRVADVKNVFSCWIPDLQDLFKGDGLGRDGTALAAFFLLVIGVLLGGASRQHELRLALVELAALPLLVLAVTALLRVESISAHRFALCIWGCVLLLPLMQLLPLPPSIWTRLPGREPLTLARDVLNHQAGWLPLSLTPDKTWRSFLALLPPVAMFLGVLAVAPLVRVRLVQLIVLAAAVSILLGAAQLASGNEGLYPWATTSSGSVTGFFANRNHLASLCLLGLPYAAVAGAASLRRRHSASNLPLWLSILYIALAIVALGVIRSRAGIVLFGPVFAASLLAAWVAAGRGRPKPLLLGLAAAAALAVAAVGAFALGPLVARFENGTSTEGRFENWPTVIQAAETHLPLGSGLGSFDAVYRSVEPLSRLDATYFNQAHNDYLETLLEAGWPGIALIVAFLFWFARRSWAAWCAEVSTQRDLQRAATIAIGVLLVHSTADYPLRTATMAMIFALSCGLLELAVRSDAKLNPKRTSQRKRVR